MSDYNRMNQIAALGNQFLAGQGMQQNQQVSEDENRRAEGYYQMAQQRQKALIGNSDREAAANQAKMQKEMIVKSAAQAFLEKGPNALNGLPPDLRFDAEVLAGSQLKRNNENKKEEMAIGYERLKSLGFMALADIESGNPNWKSSFKEFQAHARDGIPYAEEMKDGKVKIAGYDGKEQILDSVSPEQASQWVHIHLDPKTYFTAKEAEQASVRKHNIDRILNGKEYAMAPDGTQGWVTKGLLRDKDHKPHDEYFIVDKQTGQARPSTEKEFNTLGMKTKKMAEAGKAIRDSAIDDTVMIGGQRIKRDDVVRELTTSAGILFNKSPDKLDAITLLLAGKPMSDLQNQRVGSAYEQALKIKDDTGANPYMREQAAAFISRMDALKPPKSLWQSFFQSDPTAGK